MRWLARTEVGVWLACFGSFGFFGCWEDKMIQKIELK